MAHSGTEVLEQLSDLVNSRPAGGTATPARDRSIDASSNDAIAAETASTLAIAAAIGVDFRTSRFTVEELRLGILIEQEHSRITHLTDVVGEDPRVAAMLALTHLRLRPDYYTRLTTAHSPGDGSSLEYPGQGVGRD